ncbi:MAG: homoserine kinase [Acidimicrobiia bacterium]
MIVSVPASSANMGPGFDTLALALSLSFELSDAPFDDRPGGAPIESTHPAAVAFARGGGVGPVWVRSPIPMGRGLGFSGAARVAGVVAAHVQRTGHFDPTNDGAQLVAMAADLEGHADNVAASLYGGAVATASGTTVRIPLGFDPAVVCWVPVGTKTSTDASRTRLGGSVPFADAVFNVGSVALLVAALASGDVAALRIATRDRLHQPQRLAAVPRSSEALESGLANGAWCGWLSGSGPTIALLCPLTAADALAAALPTEHGHAKVLRVDHAGTTVE